ncbi:Recombination protein N [Actinomyces bovis]|uniref:DNA repair protein RecN n=1 Tax=Actinomyces bovis TaxID=1658 RepID=A0ABY1VQ39_9ACTO|nr:DNA repair protein RecN [Actinomyces bovis]SPT54175.1 Recombination protein N [Actinomyces bovis]VEG53544.1 Recombination protein N [Actinomyces israelii]
MIESLHIENLGVIEQAELSLSPGLTALTGETGAGKTMVLTSLGLLLGQRAESSVVRSGAQAARVEGTWLLDPDSRTAQRATDAGAALDDDLLVASRTVPAQGRSRAHLGGAAVPSTVLGEVGNRLVSVHGQADQLRLRSVAAQRAALDSLGGAPHNSLCRRYAAAYRRHQAAATALTEWQAGTRQRAEEAESLRTWLDQLEQLAPQPGEDHALTAEAQRLDHAEDLRRATLWARNALTAEEEAGPQGEAPDVVSLIAAASRALEPVTSLDPALQSQATRLQELSYLAADIASELSDHLAHLDADPNRLAAVQERRAQLLRACQEIGGASAQTDDVDALLAWGHTAAARLAEIDGPEDTQAELTQELAAAQQELKSLAQELTAARQQLANSLQEGVTAELTGLEMKGARLVVELAPLDEPGPTGAETVTLLLIPHPGAPALPLGKGASGGELSRIMLALEVVLAEANASNASTPSSREHARTLIFDEIDAGVGGRAAREIGRRLARLARRYQVIVVTHLAQVAAWADTQLVVRKETGSEVGGAGQLERARTYVEPVTGRARERELARMLSGHEDSQAALRHAAELLAEANVAQSQP